MYPLKFKHIYFDKIWGGRSFENFRSDLPQGNIGESWDVACHDNGLSVIANGEYEGLTLKELINIEGEKLLGRNVLKEHFPILIKLISTSQRLSIQVHPNDKYAYEVEGESGKTEAWYIVEAEEGASIVVGCDHCTKESMQKAINTGEFEGLAHKVFVKKGEVYFIKSGLIHAIGSGLVIAEIQQNSDTTYRVYDYDRGRELHIGKALDVIDLNMIGKKSNGLKVEYEGYSKTYYCLDEHFALEVYDVERCCCLNSDIDRFNVLTCVDGDAKIVCDKLCVDINKGDSVMIPACLGNYEVIGQVKFINSYVPDVKKVKKEVLNILEA